MKQAGKEFSQKLISWYGIHKRDLPWRSSNDPYKIWLSEILLQQTRVNQGMPYYYKFIEAFPEIGSLANAGETEVLRLWQGLGYYSRARNLHHTAKLIISNYSGNFPGSYQKLLKLKGVGKYTAAAIASFAFDEKVAVVDGNVYRVLSRVFGIKTDISSPAGQKEFSLLANELLPDKNVNTYNQAIMEFGALHCTPQNPGCLECPLAAMCYANMYGLQRSLPFKAKKAEKKNRYLNYVVLKEGEKYFMRERKGNDIWKGLYEFLLVEEKELISIENLLKKLFEKTSVKTKVIKESIEYKHILTHRNIYSKFWVVEVNKTGIEEIKTAFYSKKQIIDLPKSVLINKFLEDYIF